jgi:uncharacterized protein with PIN domain
MLTCPDCKINLELVKKKKVFDLNNHGKIAIECESYDCSRCGQEFFDEEQSLFVAKELDKALKEERKIEIKSGSILV